MIERWARVTADHRYTVSSLGRVRRDIVNARILRGSVDRYGYRTVFLMGKRYKVHRLVCEAFNGPCPSGLECAHLNSDKSDNRDENLAWVTRPENQRHNVARGVHGGGVAGESHPSAKLTADQVAEIRRKAASGRSGRSLAREFGIGSAQASAIIRGDAWKPCAHPSTPES